MTFTAVGLMLLALVGLIQARQSLGNGAGQMFDALAGSGESSAPASNQAASDGTGSAAIDVASEPTGQQHAEGSAEESDTDAND